MCVSQMARPDFPNGKVHFSHEGPFAQSSFPRQRCWCDWGMYSALVLGWHVPHVARGQCSQWSLWSGGEGGAIT